MKYELPIDSEYNKEENISIKNLDDFYNTKLTKENDIRNLGTELLRLMHKKIIVLL